MFDLAGAVGGLDGDALASGLKRHLCGPVVVRGPAEPRSPEYDLIDALRAGALDGKGIAILAVALRAVLADCEAAVGVEATRAEATTLAGRIGFLISATSLEVDGAPLFRIAMHLKLLEGLGTPVDPEDFFLILKGVGRVTSRDASRSVLSLFWFDLLAAPHRGLRTLAAQNLVRVDPANAVIRLDEMLAADVGVHLVAFELLKAVGGAEVLGRLAAAYIGSEALSILHAAFLEIDEPEAAAALVPAIARPEREVAADVLDAKLLSEAAEGLWARRRQEAGGFRAAVIARVARRFMEAAAGGPAPAAHRIDPDAVVAARRMPMLEDA